MNEDNLKVNHQIIPIRASRYYWHPAVVLYGNGESKANGVSLSDFGSGSVR